MSRSEECGQKGHHWHEVDETPGPWPVFIRHNKRPVDDVNIACCHCGAVAMASAKSKQAAPSLASISYKDCRQGPV